MNKISILSIITIFSLGCALLPGTLESPTQYAKADCQMPIADKEIDEMLDYQHALFEEGDWIRSYTVNEDQAFVSYVSDSMSAVVHVNIIRLCAAGTELENYASPQTLQIITANYDDVSLEDSCKQDGLLLFQFSAMDQGDTYNSRLWFALTEDPNRILKVMIVLPEWNEAQMDSFSQAFFPDFSVCAESR